MKDKGRKMKQGFTLLETLVAIAILLLAVVGPMSAIGGSLSQISTARDQMIAVNLAQEGIEVVRQKRDSNMLNRWRSGMTGDWLIGITSAPDCSTNECTVDALTSSLTACTSTPCGADQKLVRQDANNFYYQGSNGTATKFSRTIRISGSGTNERTVTSTVTWSVGGGTRMVEVKESIFGINS